MPRSSNKIQRFTESIVNFRDDNAAMGLRLSASHVKQLTGSAWDVDLLIEGWSLNDRFYTVEILERFKELMEAMPEGKTRAQAFIIGDKFDHLPDEMRDLTPGAAGNLVGWFSNPRVVEGEGGRKVLRARLTIHTGAQWLRDLLKEAFDDNASGLLGLSLDAEGVLRLGEREGREGGIVERITKLNSFDIVTDPAAGGKFRRIAASTNTGGRPMRLLERFFKLILNQLGVTIEDGMTVKQMGESILKHERVIAGSALKAGVNEILDLLIESQSDERDKKVDEFVATLATSDALSEGLADAVKDDKDKDKKDDKVDPPKDKDKDKQDPPKNDDKSAAQKILDEARSEMAKAKKELDEVRGELAKDKEKFDAEKALDTSNALVRQHVGESGLPDAIRTKLSSQLTGTTHTEDAVRKVIREEKEAYSSLLRESNIVDLGDVVFTNGRDREDKFQRALDLMVGVDPLVIDPKREDKALQEAYAGIKKYRGGLKKLYIEMTGDELVSGVMNPKVVSRVREAITTATFAFALGTSMERRLQQEYMLLQFGHPAFSKTVDVDNFKLQERIQWESFGDLDTVAEGAVYTELTVGGDFEATYTATKRGNIVSITRESIINDDLSIIQRTPGMMARSAGRTLEKFVTNLLLSFTAAINDTNIYDGTVLYTVGHANLGVLALSSTSLEAARQRMWAHTDPSTEDTLGLRPSAIIVPIELEQTANVLLKSEFLPGTDQNDINTLRGLIPTIVTSPYLQSDVNNWYLVAEGATIDTIEVGFVNGQELPAMFLQDSPTEGNVFTNDKITYKVRHEYGGAVMDFRAFDGSIVP